MAIQMADQRIAQLETTRNLSHYIMHLDMDGR